MFPTPFTPVLFVGKINLTEKIRKHPYSVVLFDEIEKADKEVLNLFLQIMDDGVLTDSCGRSASFKNSYIIMTSNAISAGIKDASLGFLGESRDALTNEKLFDFFSPEFINRIDNVIYFKPLTQEAMIKIVMKTLSKLKSRLENLNVILEYDHAVCEYIAKRTIDKRLGARTVLRNVTNEIENKISALMLEGELDSVKFALESDALKCTPTFKKQSAEKSELIK